MESLLHCACSGNRYINNGRFFGWIIFTSDMKSKYIHASLGGSPEITWDVDGLLFVTLIKRDS